MMTLKNVVVSFESPLTKLWTVRDFFVGAFDFKESRQKLFFNLGPLNLQFSQGEKVGIIGQNGAGKSTFCRLVSGFYRPIRGDVVVGANVLAMLDSDLSFYPDLTGRENVSITLEFLWPELMNQKIKLMDSIIKFSGLGMHIDKPLRTYSLGMRTRLCLSIYGSGKREILIIDEVLDGVDLSFQTIWNDRFNEMLESSKLAILVSHNFEVIKRICNRVIVLESGQIVFDGRPGEAIIFYENMVKIAK